MFGDGGEMGDVDDVRLHSILSHLDVVVVGLQHPRLAECLRLYFVYQTLPTFPVILCILLLTIISMLVILVYNPTCAA